MKVDTGLIGIILSVIALGWNIFKDLNDKGKLRITGMLAVIPPNLETDYLVISAVNIGKRPILIKGWGADNDKGGHLFVNSAVFPRSLKESEEAVDYVSDLSLLSPEITAIYAWDSTGKKWFLARKDLKRLQREFAKKQSN